MIISQTKIFGRQLKKLKPNQKTVFDQEVKAIATDPGMGEIKKGDLQGVRVHKFKAVNQEYLLAYVIIENHLTLLSFGSHENFYRDLKKSL